VAEIIYARSAFDDLRRMYDATAADDPTLAANLSVLIRQAVHALQAAPLLGRAAEAGLRERAISRGKTGYVALYRYLELEDIVLVLAIRARSEAGYPA
jgi:plasmid stabilization system protein ParE